MRASAMSGSNNIVDVATAAAAFSGLHPIRHREYLNGPVARKKASELCVAVQVAHPYRAFQAFEKCRWHTPSGCSADFLRSVEIWVDRAHETNPLISGQPKLLPISRQGS